jgi:hypothetical protein
MAAQVKPRKYSAVQVPREYRMRLLRALDVIAVVKGQQEGAECAPSAEVWLWLTEKLETSAAQIRPANYRPSLWLQEKERGATSLDQIVEELGIA